MAELIGSGEIGKFTRYCSFDRAKEAVMTYIADMYGDVSADEKNNVTYSNLSIVVRRNTVDNGYAAGCPREDGYCNGPCCATTHVFAATDIDGGNMKEIGSYTTFKAWPSGEIGRTNMSGSFTLAPGESKTIPAGKVTSCGTTSYSVTVSNSMDEAPGCGGEGASAQKQHISFKTSNSSGNGLLAAGGGGSTCIFPGTTTYEKIEQNVTSWVLSPSDLAAGNFDAPLTKYEHTQTVTVEKTTGGFTNNWALYPFYVNVEADMDIYYKNNHLMVRLTNIKSTIIGSQDADANNCNASNLIPGYGNPFSFGLAVSLTPTPNDGQWKDCLGGWWLEPQAGCTANCQGLQNPPGGFNYYWGCKTEDAPFAKSPNPGRTNAGPYEWDLGDKKSINIGKNLIYVTGRVLESSNRSNPCSGMVQKYGTSQYANAYNIPAIDVCPPEIIYEDHSIDICEDCAIVKMTAAANDLLGASNGQLFVEYVWEGNLDNPDWSEAEGFYVPLTKDTAKDFQWPCLIGRSHYIWRMKVIVSEMDAESEYIYGEFDTLFIPPANMTVPEISTYECTEINNGNLVPPFEEIVYYGMERKYE